MTLVNNATFHQNSSKPKENQPEFGRFLDFRKWRNWSFLCIFLCRFAIRLFFEPIQQIAQLNRVQQQRIQEHPAEGKTSKQISYYRVSFVLTEHSA